VYNIGKLLGILPISSLLPFLVSFDLSTAAVAAEGAYTVTTEIFLQRDRILGNAIVGILQNCFGGLLTATILTVINTYGTQYVLAPFMLINIFYIIGVHKWLIETNGISASVSVLFLNSAKIITILGNCETVSRRASHIL
jgi:hypothetical protein